MHQPFVFLSYSRKDSEIADRVAIALGERGIRLWRDTHDILPGADWRKEIFGAIEKSSAIIYLASRNSASSSFIINKLNLLASKDTPIFPLLVDETPIQQFPSTIVNRYQFLDLRSDFQSGIETLCQSLINIGYKVSPVAQVPSTTSNKGYAFISYAKEDTHHVAVVTGFLKDRSYAHFDYKSSDRRFEDDFDIELEDRLSAASLVACIITPNWKKATWPKKEYLFASKIGVPTFLLQFEDPGPSILIIDRTPIDFSHDVQSGLKTLAAEFERLGA